MLFWLVVVSAVAVVYFGLSWCFVAVFGREARRAVVRPVLARLIDKRRLSGRHGYMSGMPLGQFHCHFYHVVLGVGGRAIQATVLRYFPDAFGRPLGKAYRPPDFVWHTERPPVLGFQLSPTRMLLWPSWMRCVRLARWRGRRAGPRKSCLEHRPSVPSHWCAPAFGP